MIATYALIAVWLWQPGGQASAEPLLASVRKSVEYDKLVAFSKGVTLTGVTRYLGEKAELTFRFSPDGRFAELVDGKFDRISGFDGKVAWETDLSGAPYPLDFGERASFLMTGWLMSGYWLSKRAPLTFSRNTAQDFELSVRLSGTEMRGTITLDPDTCLPTQFVQTDGQDPRRIRFSRWNNELGFWFPHRIEISEGGMAYTLDFTRAQATADATMYALPKWTASDTRFDPSVPAHVETMKSRSGHLLVKPYVGGKSVGWFLFDTGAGSMVLDSKIADELGTESFGRVPARGVAGTVVTRFRRGAAFELGRITLTDPVYVELDLRPISQILGTQISGIVGFDLLRRSVVEYDVRSGSLAIYDPNGFTLPKGGWETLRLSSRHPTIACKFEGDRQGVFRLDTGSNDTVIFHGPTVERLRLLEGRTLRTVPLGGVGGMTSAKAGKIAYFEIAGYRFESPNARFADTKIGAFGEGYLDGNVGQRFLDPFTVYLDYPNQRIALIRNDTDRAPLAFLWAHAMRRRATDSRDSLWLGVIPCANDSTDNALR
jgi:predicted aspartyl protease